MSQSAPVPNQPKNAASLMLALPSDEPMLAQVGKALASFNDVEFHLSAVYFALVHPLPTMVAILHYDEMPNLSSRQRVLKKLGDLRLSGPRKSEFKSLMKKVAALTEKRNTIAHFRAGPWHPSGKICHELLEEVEIRLMPGLARFLPGKDELESLTLDEVTEFQNECMITCMELVRFSRQLEEANLRTPPSATTLT